MARGQNDTSDVDEGPVLSPEELGISDDEHVAEIDEGRYLVSPNAPVDDVGTDTGNDARRSGARQSPPSRQRQPPESLEATRSEVTEEDIRAWLTDQFEQSNSRYGFDVTAMFDGRVHQRQMISNDVVTIFESLILWYAQQIDSTTPVEEVLGILLMEANVPIRYPPGSLHTLLESTDLSPDDTIAELLEAVGDQDDGFRL